MLGWIVNGAGKRHRLGARVMRKSIAASTIAVLALACGPEASDEDDLPGKLVYEDSYTKVYRLDRRIDLVIEQEHGERRECGFLTDRAHDELEATIDALDPGVDYGYDADVLDCNYRPMAWVHIEGFEHSPFECSWMCCRPELIWVAVVYSMVINNVYGATPIYEGEPYVALEPDRPCE
jgi:hypothetical protein